MDTKLALAVTGGAAAGAALMYLAMSRKAETAASTAVTAVTTLAQRHLRMQALNEETELDFSSNDLGPREVILIAVTIKACMSRVLTKLNLSMNNLPDLATAEAGSALGEALKGNAVLKELNVSGCGHLRSIDGPGFAHGISSGLLGNRGLTSLDLASNGIGAEGATHIAEAIKVSTCVVVSQLSNNSCYSAEYGGFVKVHVQW
jgi:Ran GTPase-activating protein (RanGAP) involved in mRNA processing and transport